MKTKARLIMLVAVLLLTIFALGCDRDSPTESSVEVDTEPALVQASVSLTCDEKDDFNAECFVTSDPDGSLAGGQWEVIRAGSFVDGKSGGNIFRFYVGEEDDPCEGIFIVSFEPRWSEGFTGDDPRDEDVNFPPEEFCPEEFPPLAVAFQCSDVGGGAIDCQNNSTGVQLPANCDFSFGDNRGTEDCAFNGVRHVYDVSLLPATFNVRLAIVDRELRSDSKTEEVTVEAP